MKHGDDGELRVLRSELLEAHRELSRLRMQNEQLVSSNRDLSSLLTRTAQRSGDLVKIIVAFRRLLEATNAGAALRSIEEILINVVGTEDFVILMVTDVPLMRVVGGMGPARTVAVASPPVFDGVFDSDGHSVPLHIGDRVVGAIIIDSVLPHRDPLNAADEQVLSLLSRFAATAVLTADQRPSWTRVNLPEVA
ncbi:MAG TPA: hypothetical protein VF483_10590 [Gemmatimonadaceae bacterium]